MSAFLDRDDPAYKRAVSRLAWGSFAWFASEPEAIVIHEGRGAAGRKLIEMLALTDEV